jgi:hypothetical protein
MIAQRRGDGDAVEARDVSARRRVLDAERIARDGPRGRDHVSDRRRPREVRPELRFREAMRRVVAREAPALEVGKSGGVRANRTPHRGRLRARRRHRRGTMAIGVGAVNCPPPLRCSSATASRFSFVLRSALL